MVRLTANQIRYADVKRQALADAEIKRHNVVSEGLDTRRTASQELFQDRSGRASLSQAAAAHISARASTTHAQAALQSASAAVINAETNQSALAETIRMNDYKIMQGSGQLQEAGRHNREMESLESRRLDLQQDMNSITQQFNEGRLSVSQYTNYLKSIEVELQQQRNEISQYEADTGRGRMIVDAIDKMLRHLETLVDMANS